MADSGSSPSSPRFSCCPWQGLETNRGWGGGGTWLGSTRGPIRPISTRETAAAYTGLLGCDLNSKFFLISSMNSKIEAKVKSNVIIG